MCKAVHTAHQPPHIAAMSGTVYVLTNDSLKGMVKIGFTTRTADIRAKELSNTSLPTPFIVAFESAKVANPRVVERTVHNQLIGSRIQNGREFFKVTIQEAIDAIRAAIEVHATHDHTLEEAKGVPHVVTVQVPAGATELVIKLEGLSLA